MKEKEREKEEEKKGLATFPTVSLLVHFLSLIKLLRPEICPLQPEIYLLIFNPIISCDFTSLPTNNTVAISDNKKPG